MLECLSSSGCSALAGSFKVATQFLDFSFDIALKTPICFRPSNPSSILSAVLPSTLCLHQLPTQPTVLVLARRARVTLRLTVEFEVTQQYNNNLPHLLPSIAMSSAAAMTTETSLLLSAPAETRNTIYKLVADDAMIFMDGLRVAGRPKPQIQVLVTSRQVRKEVLPIVLAGAFFWFGAINGNLLGVMNVIPIVFSGFIRDIVLTQSAAESLNAAAIAMLPMLRSVEISLGVIDWLAATKEEILNVTNETATNLSAFRDLFSNHQDFFSSFDPTIIPARVQILVSFPIRARSLSKALLLSMEEDPGVPAVDDQEVTFVSSYTSSAPMPLLTSLQELRYVWSSGELFESKEDLAKVQQELLSRLEKDKKINELREEWADGDLDDDDEEEADWEIDAWDDRGGLLLVGEKRRWAFEGVVCGFAI